MSAAITGLLGPLTSEFIPAATCISQNIQVVRYVSDSSQGYNYYLTAGPGVSTCFPSSQFPSLGSYYSPGRCPSGYSAACTTTGGNSVGNATETTVTCCPMIPYAFECNIKPVGSDWGVFADCTTSTTSLEVDLDVIGAVPTSKLVGSPRDTNGNPILTQAIINGYGIQIRWQQSDEALLFSTSSTTDYFLMSSSDSQTTSGQPTILPLKDEGNAGIIAGIVVGAVVGFLVLIGIVAMVIRSKRRQRQLLQNQQASGPNHLSWKQAVELPKFGENQDVPSIFQKYELPTPKPTGVIPRQELPAGHTAQEYSSGNQENWQGGARSEDLVGFVGELEAVEHRGELEAELHRAELEDNNRQRHNRV
ncbi:hypothetical protein F4825DRAFT_441446 [Nemania diffusa]|nr:hypothetical protein F4825DRAFT_441446 [Nemania diffusa]